jgi:hypothetical protein
MTCSKNFGRLLQASCLGLIGMLTVVGCGGSENPTHNDGGGFDGGPGGPTGAALTVTPSAVNFGSVDLGKSGTGTVTVTNTGTAASGALSVVPGAGMTATGCSGALAAKASCTMTITATPTVVGLFNGSISISANPGAITPLQVSVSGNITPVGQFSVTPGTISLGDLLVGAVAPKQTITVTAQVALTDLAVNLNGAEVTKDATSTCVAALAANASCTVVVNFTAASAGPKSDSVIISAGGANGKVVTIPVTATVQAPAKLVISPSSPQAFATTVNVPSSAVAFGVANSGDVATGAITVAVTGANAADFTATATGCTILAPVAGCTISVVFAPKAASTTPETGNLVVTDTATGGSSVTVVLNGTVYAPSNLAITSTVTDLGSVLVGQTGSTVAFTVTNKGDTASGAVTVAVSSPEVVIVNDTCTGTSVAKGATCTIGLALKPANAGAKTAILTVTPGNGAAAVINVTGTGLTAGALSATPASLDFGTVRINNTSTAQTATIKNNGGTATGALTLTKSGNFGVFTVASNTCSAALAPGATCTFSVTFAPVAAGSQSATLTVTDGTAAVAVALAGNAQDSTGITVTPNPALACTTINTTNCWNDLVIAGSETNTFTVKADANLKGAADTGAITATVVGANATDFVVTQNTCTAALLANAQCVIKVAFSPTAAGSRQATLSVTTANGGSDNVTFQANGLPVLKVYACTGTAGACPEAGDATTLSTAAADLDFGQVSLNSTTGATKTFRTIVRGPTSAASPFPANTVSVVLNDPATTGANFSNVSSTTINGCTGAALTVSGSHPDVTATGGNVWHYNATYQGYYCDFTIKFLPQGTVKEVKTASLTATGSATNGGTDTEALTGTATGPLTITLDPASPSFPSSVTIGDSTNADHNQITLTLANDTTITLNPNVTLDINNHSTTVTLTPVALSLTGTQFQIVDDPCTDTSIAPGATCKIVVAFSPTGTPGVDSSTLTVTAGSETATYALSATAGSNLAALSPLGTVAAPIDIGGGPIVEGNASAWKIFTVSNPAGAPKTDQISWDSPTDSAHFAFDGTQGSTPCGQSGITALNPGTSCTIGVKYMALTTDALTTPATLATDVLTVHVNGSPLASQISGTPTTKLSVTSAQATKTVGGVAAYDFGNVAVGTTSTAVVLTLANLSGAAITAHAVAGTVGNFAIVSGTGPCATSPYSLGAAGSATATCTVSVKFTGRTDVTPLPHQEGTAPDTVVPSIVFEEVATGAKSTATAYLTGNTVSPASLQVVGLPTTGTVVADLGSVVNPNATVPVTFTFQNPGDVAATNLQFAWSPGSGEACATSADPRVCDPFQVVAETGGCFQLTTLPAKGTCSISIKSSPSNSLVPAGLKSIHFTLSADQGIAVTTAFKLTTTVDRADAASSDVYFDYGSPASFGFLPFVAATTGRTAIGASSAQTLVTIENKTGTTPSLPADAAGWAAAVLDTTTATATTDFVVAPGGSNPCTTTLGTSCTLGVTFTPKAPFDSTTVFRFASLVVGGNTLGLVGEVKSPAKLTISPAPLAFGEVVVSTSTSLTATVTNSGQTDASGITINPGNASVYNVTGCTGTVTANGGTCTLTATIVAPSAAGTANATLTVTDSAGDTATDSMTATAVSSSSLAVTTDTADNAGSTFTVVDPNTKAFDFGTGVLVVGDSPTQVATFTITNPNTETTGPLAFTLTGNTDSFTLDSTDCMTGSPATGLKLSNASCTVTVTFQPVSHAGPTVAGDLTTALSVSALASTTITGAATITKVVNITGHSKSALSFVGTDGTTLLTAPVAVVSTAAGTTIKVKSLVPGTQSALLSTVSLTTADAASFYITENTCWYNSLPSTESGQTCTIVVQYVGGTTTTAKNAVLTVSDGTTQFTNTIALKYTP